MTDPSPRQFKPLPWSYEDIDPDMVDDLDAATLAEWLRLAWERGYGTRQSDRNAGMPGTVWHSANPYEPPAAPPPSTSTWRRWLRRRD